MNNNTSEREHTVIIPKYDNSGRKIKPEVIRKYSNKLSERFGGVTIIPSILGCWIGKDNKQVCEENIIIRANRDLDQTPKLTNDKKLEIIKQDREFINRLSKEIGEDLGQEAIMTSEDDVEISFMKGRRKEELEKEKIGLDWFERLI